MNDRKKDFLLKSLKSQLPQSKGMVYKSIEYKIKKIESKKSENYCTTTSVITKSSLNEVLKREMEILEGYKGLKMDDSVINDAIEPIVAFQTSKIFLIRKRLREEFSCYKTTLDFTTGLLTLRINSMEFDPCNVIKNIAFYVDRKCQNTIEIENSDTEVTLILENSLLTEIYLIGENTKTLLGMVIFPCDFFINPAQNNIVVDFGDFNYIEFSTSFKNAIQLRRNEAKIKCLSKEGHLFERCYCGTPVYCNVCTKMCPIFGNAFKCSNCNVRVHGNCSNYILFKCKKVINHTSERIKKNYNIEHNMQYSTSRGIRYCEHCGERIGLGTFMCSCKVCFNNYHKDCEPMVFNSCGLSMELRKKMAEFCPKSPNKIQKRKIVKIRDFSLEAVLGSGTFGKVVLAKHIEDGITVALKVLKKDKMINSYDMCFLEAERRILEIITGLSCNLLSKMIYCFQDEYNVYFGLEYCCGGDLLNYVKNNVLSEDQIRGYASELVVAISVLHKNNIAFRDLKLDNILIGSDGHLKLCDFGLSKDSMLPSSITYTYCGTPDTIAPEVFTLKGYTRNVDFWSLGVVIYEMFHRTPPFYGATTKELAKNIAKHDPEIRVELSKEAEDFIKQLLVKNTESRIGSGENAVVNIKSHPWFKDVNWDDVLYSKNEVFFIPSGEVIIDKELENHSVKLSETLSVRGFQNFFNNFN